jgi:hypothetical protein
MDKPSGMLPFSRFRKGVLMAQFFEQIICNINNSELRIALEQLFAIMGVGRGSQVGNPGFVGNIVGNLTGDQLGNMTGDVAGNVTGYVKGAVQSIDDDLDLADGDFFGTTILLDGDGTCDISNWTPTVGREYTLFCIDSTTDPTVTLTSGITINAAGNDIMTFAAAEDNITLVCVSPTLMIIKGTQVNVSLSTAS